MPSHSPIRKSTEKVKKPTRGPNPGKRSRRTKNQTYHSVFLPLACHCRSLWKKTKKAFLQTVDNQASSRTNSYSSPTLRLPCPYPTLREVGDGWCLASRQEGERMVEKRWQDGVQRGWWLRGWSDTGREDEGVSQSRWGV